MILPNHPRCRLALKILLALTFPVWVLALIPIAAIGLVACMFWEAASDVVDGRTRPSFGGKRGP